MGRSTLTQTDGYHYREEAQRRGKCGGTTFKKIFRAEATEYYPGATHN